jgi:phosphatidyl-myo-inositol alpha-mannosyltransferase
MRIAHVQPYDHSVSGGVRAHIVNLARHHREMGHDVTVITSASRPEAVTDDVVLVSQGGVVPLPGAQSIAHVPLSPLAWWRVRGLVRSGRFDVVHVHEPLLPMVSMAATCHADAVTVGTIHGYRPRFILYRLFRFVLEPMIRRLSARVAVSVDAREWVTRYFPGHYHVIPDGVDVARFSDPAVAPVERLDDGRPNVLFVGRLDRRKGFPVLVEAWEAVQRAVPGARLVVVGHFGEDERRHWAAEVSARGLRDVELVGFVDDDELPRYYRTARVFCAPSTGFEALGIVLLEAMAAGAAVVTTDIEGYRTVVRHGVEGIVVPPRDPAALAEGIVALLRDPDHHHRLVEGGRRRVEDYAWPRLARRLVALYESLGAGDGGATRAGRAEAVARVAEAVGLVRVPAPEVHPGVSFAEMGLDSLDLAELVTALEERTGVVVDDDDLAHLRTVGDLADLLVVRSS